MNELVLDWRRRKSAAFDLADNSTAGRTIELDLWGRPVSVYANANFSVYSAQVCNARCRFCVEELRPASRGRLLEQQRTVEEDDACYFAALERSLEVLRPLAPTISITGGEPSKDPRLPRILALCRQFPSKRRSLTTNGSGLLDRYDGARIIDHVVAGEVEHLNISRAHPDHDRNARLMVFHEGLSLEQLREVVATARAGNCRVRLSCVLVERAIDSLAGIREYLDFAESLGVDNVIFRQLMHVDRESVAENFVVAFSDRRRTQLEPLLDQISESPDFAFQKQIVGYYYYVEVWRYRGIDVVFEEADLAQLERTKRTMPGVVHELIFHPNARLASTWQPWDGVLGPP
jgi:GTP 3',8-cyclase